MIYELINQTTKVYLTRQLKVIIEIKLIGELEVDYTQYWIACLTILLLN